MMTLPNVGRRLAQSLLIALVAVPLASVPAHASSIVYAINTTITSANPTGNPLQSNTITGSITTDGTIGVLASSNVQSWNLNLVDNLNAADDVTLTNANSQLVDIGGGLSATATGLSFNFSSPSTAEFLIQGNQFGLDSGFQYFCFSTGNACLAGETITPFQIDTDGAVLTGTAAPVGVQPLNPNPPPTPPSGVVPEPSTYGLVLTGLLGLGGSLKRKYFS
jgi:hypothetical protein